MTKVINLFGGPSTGKSTLSSEIYFKMKKADFSIELCREYIKDWAYEKRKANIYDQFYISGQQVRKESLLYHKVDYIITDSPILLGPFYQEYNHKIKVMEPSILEHIKLAESQGVQFYNFYLPRKNKYVEEGRYENEQEAYLLDKSLKEWLGSRIYYINLECDLEERANLIVKEISTQ